MRGLWLVLLVGCSARLGYSIQPPDPDGGPVGNGGGSNQTSPADAAPDAAVCASGRVLYLEFEGAALTATNAASDATQNQAQWLGVGDATMPPFRQGAGDRATQIADTVTAIQTTLAGFPDIQIVTTRPVAGPYFMIGFGGSNQDANVPYLYAVNRLDCNDAGTKSDVAWVFEAAENPQRAANFAIGALLFGLGATGTNDSNDCMCGWLTSCNPGNGACTISTQINAAAGCNAANPVDETTYLAGFCD